jgi:hypothetical protein
VGVRSQSPHGGPLRCACKSRGAKAWKQQVSAQGQTRPGAAPRGPRAASSLRMRHHSLAGQVRGRGHAGRPAAARGGGLDAHAAARGGAAHARAHADGLLGEHFGCEGGHARGRAAFDRWVPDDGLSPPGVQVPEACAALVFAAAAAMGRGRAAPPGAARGWPTGRPRPPESCWCCGLHPSDAARARCACSLRAARIDRCLRLFSPLSCHAPSDWSTQGIERALKCGCLWCVDGMQSRGSSGLGFSLPCRVKRRAAPLRPRCRAIKILVGSWRVSALSDR